MINDIICWWSGGITSAIAGLKAIDIYGLDRCRFVFIDTGNEDADTYRFKDDCKKLYGKPIETISGLGENQYATGKYSNIEDVWDEYHSLNVANGAICSANLKREVRKKFAQQNEFAHMVFGFEAGNKEINRALAMKLNYPETKPIFPLLMYALTKKDCIAICEEAGIEPPAAYQYGFHNNNCLQTGCVQGGIGYWQKMQRDFPDKFQAMAEREHRYTDIKGYPVTMLKDQTKEGKAKKEKWKGGDLIFLLPHPDYPYNKSLADMRPMQVEPLMECNGYCGTHDLSQTGNQRTSQQLNFEDYNVQDIEELLKA